MKRKLITLFLVLVLAFSIVGAVTAFGIDTSGSDEDYTPGSSEANYTIPDSYAQYKAIVFDASGKAIGGYNSFNANESSAFHKAKNTLSSNRGSTVTILLRDNFEINAYYSNSGQVIGNIYIDLNGYTLTQSGKEIMNAQAKYVSGDKGLDSSRIIFKNGKIILNDKGLFQTGIYGTTYDSDDNTFKIMAYEFDNVNISLAEGATINSLFGVFTEDSTVGRYSTSLAEDEIPDTAHRQTMMLDVKFNDSCTIDITNAPAGFVLFNANDPKTSENKLTYSNKTNHYFNTNSVVNVVVEG